MAWSVQKCSIIYSHAGMESGVLGAWGEPQRATQGKSRSAIVSDVLCLFGFLVIFSPYKNVQVYIIIKEALKRLGFLLVEGKKQFLPSE